MKKLIVALILFVSINLYSMEHVFECCDAHHPDCITRHDCTEKETLESPAYGAKIERHGDSYLVKRIRKPRTFMGFLKGTLDITTYTITQVIPGNITLWKNADGSYDVLYRKDDGVVVAKNLETGQELYTIKIPRAEGTEKLLQSPEGVVVVVDKNGKNSRLWSHNRFRKIRHTPIKVDCAAVLPNGTHNE